MELSHVRCSAEDSCLRWLGLVTPLPSVVLLAAYKSRASSAVLQIPCMDQCLLVHNCICPGLFPKSKATILPLGCFICCKSSSVHRMTEQHGCRSDLPLLDHAVMSSRMSSALREPGRSKSWCQSGLCQLCNAPLPHSECPC